MRNSRIVLTSTDAKATQVCGQTKVHASGTRVVSVCHLLGVAPSQQLLECVNVGIIPTMKDAANAWERREEASEVGEEL